MGVLTSISIGGGGGGGANPKAPLIQDSVNTLYTSSGTESALVNVRSGNDPAKINGVNVLLSAPASGYQAPLAPVAFVSGNMFNATGSSGHIQTTWYQNTTSVVVRVIFRFGINNATSFSSNGFEHFAMFSGLNGEANGVFTNNQSTFSYSGASTETGGPLGLKSGILHNSGQFNGSIYSSTNGIDYLDISGVDSLSTAPNLGGTVIIFHVLPGHDIRTGFQNYTSNGANNVVGVANFEVLGSDVIGTTLGGSGDWTSFVLPNSSTFQGGQYVITEYDD